MAYIGNDLQVAYPTYKVIDDISSSFNGSTTSFPLLVSGSAPTPLPLNSQQCLISVAGVVQRPDDTGTEGFRLSGGNIVFSSAPATGADFFGVILAGADYVNAGGTFPDGSVAVPSITFNDDADTGLFRSGSGSIGVTCDAVNSVTLSSTGLQSILGSAANPSLSFIGDLNTGIYSPGADSVAISTNGSQRATVDSSGRLLVGTSSAAVSQSSIFQVVGGDTARPLIHRNVNDQWESVLTLSKARGTGAEAVINNDALGTIFFKGANGSTLNTAASIGVLVDGAVTGGGSNDMPGRLVFSTTADGASSPTERMRIDNGGAVSIGTTGAPGSTVFGVAFGRAGNTGLLEQSRNVSGSTAAAALGGNAGVAFVMGDGDLENTNNRYTGISDIKLKQNVEDSTSQWNDLKAVRVRKYELKAHPDRKHIGVIAQELEQVCPGLVIEREDRDGETYKSVAYSVLYMKAVKALQEAMERIETLEAKVAALEGA